MVPGQSVSWGHLSSVLAPVLPSLVLQDDEEWDDYRENKKDFTGLKIDNLTVEEPKEEEEEETEVNEDGETVVKKREGKDGPWSKLAEGGGHQAQAEVVEREEPRQEEKREAEALLASSGVQVARGHVNCNFAR